MQSQSKVRHEKGTHNNVYNGVHENTMLSHNVPITMTCFECLKQKYANPCTQISDTSQSTISPLPARNFLSLTTKAQKAKTKISQRR